MIAKMQQHEYANCTSILFEGSACFDVVYYGNEAEFKVDADAEESAIKDELYKAIIETLYKLTDFARTEPYFAFRFSFMCSQNFLQNKDTCTFSLNQQDHNIPFNKKCKKCVE